MKHKVTVHNMNSRCCIFLPDNHNRVWVIVSREAVARTNTKEIKNAFATVILAHV